MMNSSNQEMMNSSNISFEVPSNQSLNSENFTTASTVNKIYDDFSGPRIQPIPYVVSIDIITGLGVIGNLMTIILMTSPKLRNHSYAVYLIFLAVFDSMFITMVATEDTLDHIFHLLYPMLSAHLALCKIWNGILTISQIMSPWTLVILTFDRYVMVVFPLQKVRFCTVKFALIACGTLVVIAIALVFPLSHYSKLDGEECIVDGARIEYYSYTLSTLLISLLPVCFLVVLNLHTICILKRASQSSLRKTKSSTSLNESKFRKITVSLVLVSSLSAVCLVPFAINFLVEYVYIATNRESSAIDLVGYIWNVLNVVRLLNYAVNFYIMIVFSQYYRKVLRQRLRCGFRLDSRDRTHDVSTSQSQRTETISTI